MGDSRGESSRKADTRGETVVMDHGEMRSTCGYCKSPGHTSISHGLWACSMTVDHYQELLDHGWRRSGCYLYKPEMERTCCPSYTIRLKADEFVPSKEQLRVLKKIERFLDGKTNKWSNQLRNSSNCSSTQGSSSSREVASESMIKVNEKNHEEDKYVKYLSRRIEDALNACIANGEFPSEIQLPEAIVKRVQPQTKKKLVEISEDLLYTSSISFQIAATLRRSQRGLASNASQGGEYLDLSPTIVANKLAFSMHQLGLLTEMSVKACHGHLNFYSSIDQMGPRLVPAAGNVFQPSSVKMKGDAKHNNLLERTFCMPSNKHKLEIRMKRSSFDPEEYALYRRYQIKIHNDKPEKVTESSYRRFLVDTPLIFCPPESCKEVPNCGFGSFHQQYLVDGKIVAVGVVDILPKCLSSKYLFWDPDFAFLSLGKYSALKEIDWVKEIQVQCCSMKYYYLGYYIHSCIKMRYKAAYYPSELLCPLRYSWVPFHIVKPLLDKKSYVVLSDFETSLNGVSSPSEPLMNSSSEQQGDMEQCIADDSLGDEDDEVEFDFEGASEYDDENNRSLGELHTEDISSIVVDLNGSRMTVKDLEQLIRPSQRKNLEMLMLQLHRFVKAVGEDLAGHMIYSIG